VTDTGSDADSDQALFTMSGYDFGQAAELRTAELFACLRVDPNAGCEKKNGGNPCPRHGVERYVPPWRGKEA